MNLEDELRRAFRRKPAPSGFAERVLARLEPRDVYPAATASVSRRMPVFRWLAAAAALALIAVGGAQYYTYQRTVAEAERVQVQIRLALQITGETLALAQRRLQEPQR